MVPLPNFFATRSGLANVTGRLFYDNKTFIKTYQKRIAEQKTGGSWHEWHYAPTAKVELGAIRPNNDQLFLPMRFWKTDQVQFSSFGMCTIISKFASHHFGNSRQKLRESELITGGAYQKVSGMAFLRLRGQTETFCVRVPCSDWQTIQLKRASKKCSVGRVFNCCATLINYNAYFFEVYINQEVSY